MKRFYQAFVSVFLVFLSLECFAQTNFPSKQVADTAKISNVMRSAALGPIPFEYISWQDNVMGASPEAAKMTRYADTPVSYALGQAQISIPLYEIHSKSLSLPIRLDYDCTGIKPNEISGIVGLGWSLQAGGVITRQVMAQPDNYLPVPEAYSSENQAQYIGQFIGGNLDTDYDLYNYSFCGRSGSFYIIPSRGIVPTEPTGLTITSTNEGFLIIDEYGTHYCFTQAENSARFLGSDDPNAPINNNSALSYNINTTTAWHLTEIRSMDRTDTITLSYNQPYSFSHVSHSYYRSIMFPYMLMGTDDYLTNFSGGWDPTPNFQTREWSTTTTSTWYPQLVDVISFNGGTLSFDYEDYNQSNSATNANRRSYPSFLSKITLKDLNQNVVQSWMFSKIVSGDYRTLLKYVTHKGNNNNIIEQWTLDYDSPNTNMGENSIDLFGYYNNTGNPSKAFLRPYNDTYTVNFSVANRDTDENAIKRLSLTSITTLSGSRTQYDYGVNKYYTNGYSDLFSSCISIGLRINSISTYDLSSGTSRLIRQRTFSYYYPNITIPEYGFKMGAFISTSEYNVLPEGGHPGYWYGSWSPMRIGTVVYSDQSNIPGLPLESARIFYSKVDELLTGDNQETIKYTWEYEASGAVSTGGGGAVWFPSTDHDNTYTNTNFNTAFNHFHQRVPTYIPRNGTQSNPTTPLGYHFQDQNRPQLHNPVRVTSYKRLIDGSFASVTQTDYSYDTVYEYLQTGYHAGMKLSLNYNGYENDYLCHLSDYDQQQVDRKVVYQRLNKKLEKEYLDDGTTKTVETSYQYDFSPSGRTSLTSGNTYYSVFPTVPVMGSILSHRQETIVYDDDTTRIYRHAAIFPDELINVSNCSWADSLISWGYRVPVGEEITTSSNNAKRAGVYQIWKHVPIYAWNQNDSLGTTFKPYCVEHYREGDNVGPTVRFPAYDAVGNPLQINVQGQPVKTYIWGYNGKYPLTEIDGIDWATVKGYLTQGQRNTVATISASSSLSSGQLLFLETEFRNALPDTSMVLIQNYTPLIGINMTEDASGRKVLYAYDTSGRLSSIKDENGHTLSEYVYNFTSGASGNPNKIEKHTYTEAYPAYWTDTEYYDGLGRCIQIVSANTSQNKDLITPIVPDFADREDAKEYLPYVSTTQYGYYGYYRPNAISEQQSYYGSGIKAYTENTYERSSRNRILSSSLPGFTETTTSSTAGSAASTVLRLSYDSSTNALSAIGYYPQNRFTVTVIEGPNGSRKESYTDEYETPYLERIKLDSSGTTADTYYIRDVYGRVVCVIPPAEAALLSDSTSGFSAANCYTYSYDKRNRVVRRQLPAQAAETLTYSHADLPLTRSRLASDGLETEVFSYEYDSFNRVVKEKYQYGNHAPVTLAEYVYDSYPSWTPTFIVESGIATNADLDNRTKGLKTAERVALLPPDVSPAAMTASSITGAELRAFYYDAKGNIIQKAKHNAMGGVNYTTSQYGFAGNLLHQRQRITVGSSSPLSTIDHIYTYDSRLRPLTVSVQLDDGTPGTLTYAYDDLQRVQSVSLGNNVDTLQYSYTLQGWISSINASQWGEELCYQSPSHAATDPLSGKVGFITEWTQQQKGTPADGASAAETYAYSYDKAGRLTESSRYEGSSSLAVNTLTEQDITYDRSGNLLSIRRFGDSSGTIAIDSLAFSYSGPRRIGWAYDMHGNVSIDPVNGSRIYWNILDMPCAIIQGNAHTQRYYLADGTLVGIDDGNTMRMNIGDAVYVLSPMAGGLVSVTWEGGILLPGTGADKVLYNINDHLGSVRAIVDGTGSVRQRFDYYPYGTVSRSWFSSMTDSPEKRYRFGGKEVTGSMMGSLIPPTIPYLDFGARLYNPRTAMWMSPDSMAEDYYPIGPHVYCAENPVNVVDPEGTDIVIHGVDGSSVVIFTSSIDNEWDLSSYGVNFQGNYYFDGIESATSFFDALGIADPSFISDGISAFLNAYQGNYWNAAFSVAAAVIPYLGDLPKVRHADDLWELYNIVVHSHHIIPKALFKKMDDLNYVLKRDDKLNRLIVPAGFHGNHPAYTDWVRARLEEKMLNGRITPEAVNSVIDQAVAEINKSYIHYSRTGENMNEYFKRLNRINP